MQLTTKELSGIEDVLSHYAVCIKKASYYKNICTDKNVKKICDDVVNKNVMIFEELLTYLN